MALPKTGDNPDDDAEDLADLMELEAQGESIFRRRAQTSSQAVVVTVAAAPAPEPASLAQASATPGESLAAA